MLNALLALVLLLPTDVAELVKRLGNDDAAGKDAALAACHHYLNTFRDDRVRRLKFDINPERLFPILRVLFTDAAGKPFLPVPDMGIWTLAPPVGAEPGTFPIVVVDDVPFMVSDWFHLNGMGDDPEDQLKRCAREGVLRARPLAPAGSPLAAADLLVAGDAFKSLKPGEGCLVADVPQWIRLQAVRAVGAPPAEIRALTLRIAGKPPEQQEAVWSEAKARFEAGSPRWEAAKGTFLPSK